jgi:hypothetical protein
VTYLREMVLHALDEAGGIQYLVNVAHKHPKAFCSLLGRVLPRQVTGADYGPVQIIAQWLPPQ